MFRNTVLLWAAPIVLLVCGSCARPTDDAPPRPEASQSELSAATEAENSLGLALFDTLRKEKTGNLFFCPPSIAEALAIAYAGAGGETAKELAAVLHLQDLAPARAHAAIGALRASVLEETPGVQIDIANAVWAQEGLRLADPYRKIVRAHYGADVDETDFKQQPDAAHKAIDAWVAKQTKGKIPTLDLNLDAQTRLVLVNAVYFFGSWTEPFQKERTRDEPFHGADGQSTNVPMMQQHEHFRYAEDDVVQVLELPYGSGELSMLVLLPRDANDLAKVESLLSDKLKDWTKSLARDDVQVALPRFRIASNLELVKPISDLGAPKMFAKDADFSNASPGEPLFVSEVIHQAVVDVNEEGTEAAAATAVTTKSSAEPNSEPKVFRADHPFLFLIRDGRSGLTLFIGRLAQP